MAHKDEFAEDIQILKLRSYQAEVLGKCLEKNVIIASPTGSEERLLG
jgi:ERCC4-related helicase